MFLVELISHPHAQFEGADTAQLIKGEGSSAPSNCVGGIHHYVYKHGTSNEVTALNNTDVPQGPGVFQETTLQITTA